MLALSSAESFLSSRWFNIQPLPSLPAGAPPEPPGRAQLPKPATRQARGAMLWEINSDWRPRPRGRLTPPNWQPAPPQGHTAAPRWASGWGPRLCAGSLSPVRAEGEASGFRAGGQGGLGGGRGEAAGRPGTAAESRRLRGPPFARGEPRAVPAKASSRAPDGSQAASLSRPFRFSLLISIVVYAPRPEQIKAILEIA